MTPKEEELRLIYKDESYAITRACFAAYKDKGCAFHEPGTCQFLSLKLSCLFVYFVGK